MEENKKTTDFGPIIGIIIVIIILIVGAFYFAGKRIQQSKEFKAAIQKELAASSTPSDEVSDIEKDANAIDTNNLGAGIENL